MMITIKRMILILVIIIMLIIVIIIIIKMIGKIISNSNNKKGSQTGLNFQGVASLACRAETGPEPLLLTLNGSL